MKTDMGETVLNLQSSLGMQLWYVNLTLWMD